MKYQCCQTWNFLRRFPDGTVDKTRWDNRLFCHMLDSNGNFIDKIKMFVDISVWHNGGVF